MVYFSLCNRLTQILTQMIDRYVPWSSRT